MGKHYVPQEYLRGFSSTADLRMIWMFDKHASQWANPAIKKVAQERGFYPPDVETVLHEQVEKPANAALRTLRRRRPLGSAEWHDLLVYISVMLTRVPRKRRKGRESFPNVLETTMVRFRLEVESLRRPGNAHRVDKTLDLLAELEASYEEAPPDEVRAQIDSPWPTQRIARAVETLAWRLLAAWPDHHFITSDNPAHFFESLGLGRDESELTFPLSPELALLGSRQGRPGSLVLETAKPRLVKEINRRMASGAERFVFAHRKAGWIEVIAGKEARLPRRNRR